MSRLIKSKFTCFVLALAAGLMPAAFAMADVTLIENGQPKAKLYIAGPLEVPTLKPKELQALTSEERGQRNRAAAMSKLVEDLNYHFEKMSGAKLEVVLTDDPAKITGPALVIGSLANKAGATPTLNTVNNESFRIIVKGDKVLVGGESEWAARHGAYEILRTLGCDWIMPGPEGEIIPETKTITLKDADISRKPDFQVRAPWYSGGPRIIMPVEFEELTLWLNRQQQTTRDMPPHPDFLTGGHFWHTLLTQYKQLMTEKPEMRALVRKIDGTTERGWAQLEPTNPDVIDLTVEHIRKMYKRNGWANDHPYTMSIGPNDGGGYSISPEALAAGADRIDPVTGDRDQTDVLILYANKVIEKVRDEFPNLKLGFLLYSVHADYPQKYIPDPKFVTTIADITYSRFHSTLDRRSTTRTYYKGILDQWKKLAKEQGNILWFYGYNWNLAENLMPYSKMKIWGQDLPYYHDIGVRGHNNEQDKAWANLGAHNYLMARMGWDITLDWKKVLADYCAKAFGPAGPAMEKYNLLLIDTMESAGQEAGSLPVIHLVFDREFVKKANALFAEAKAAGGTEIQKKRVDYFTQPVQMLSIYLDYRDALTSFNYVEAQKHFEAMLANWEHYNSLNHNLVSRYGRRYIDTWLIRPMVTQGVKYSTGDYKIVHKLPDELKTALDPHTKGQEMGFFRPEVSDKGWIKTKTYSSTFDAQGLGPYRPGAIWYRDTFTIPESEKADGKGIGLFVGAVEDLVNVWINGQYVGSGRGYIRPFQFDLTPHIKYGEPNTLALQVVRRNMLNEAGLGGIINPCFIFSGPRLEKAAPLNEPARRILPGGALGEIEN